MHWQMEDEAGNWTAILFTVAPVHAAWRGPTPVSAGWCGAHIHDRPRYLMPKEETVWEAFELTLPLA